MSININGKSRPLGLLGYPVKHTASPAMHNCGFEALHLNYVYLPFEISPEQLHTAVKALIPLNFKGVNVTIPHKQNIIPLLDDLSEEARLIGAVNTVEIKEGKLIGHNTDAAGFIESLKIDADFNLNKKTLCLFGAGGAGFAVAFAAALAGAEKIFIREPNSAQANNLKTSLQKNFPNLQISIVTEDSNIKKAVQEADILVNATPLGMKESDPLVIPAEFIHPNLLVYDLVYNPAETKLLAIAKQKRCQAINGLGMLLFQGTKAFEIWTGEKAPLEKMKKALISTIGIK